MITNPDGGREAANPSGSIDLYVPDLVVANQRDHRLMAGNPSGSIRVFISRKKNEL